MAQTVNEEYYCVLTNAGATLEAEAHAKGVPVRLTHIAVGDGDGEVPQPAPAATALINEVYRREIDASRVDEDDPNICWISAVIPANAGGFWIREFAIYAESLEEGGEPVFYAYGNHAPFYKIDKILGQASTHELEIPVIMTGSASVQIAVKDAGYASQSAFNGLSALVGQMRITDQQYGERLSAVEAWQLAHAMATLEKLGLVRPDGKTIAIGEDGEISVAQGRHWLLGEFYFFRHPQPRPGFEVLDGGVIENGAEMYPEFWQYIQTTSGQALCLTAEERQALANHVYYTLADGTPVTYNGIGGVPFFTIDMATGAITMPDIRGMHIEAAGFDSLNVGGVRMDEMRQISGVLHIQNYFVYVPSTTGAFYTNVNAPHRNPNATGVATGNDGVCAGIFASSRVVPTGAAIRPRSFGVLACAYMGATAL